MKRLLIFLLALVLAACGAKQEKNEETRYENPAFTAAVSSDLHYTASPSEFSSIVPLEPLVPEVTDALVSQVIALKPDAFIMTGDNTSNGKEEDVKELSEKLKKLKDAGIEIILTAGNHDYGQGDRSVRAWEEYILPLLDMEERDLDSYSYMTVNNGVTILAMDDSHPGDSAGYFSGKTMRWLQKQLETAKENGSRVLFLSHHNVICGKKAEMYGSYLIQNEGLTDLLEEYGVQLCMSGHQHNQAVWQMNDMYEVLSGMPVQGAHTFGLLSMDENGVRYHTEEIDLEKYGASGVYEKARDLMERQSASFFSSFEKLCKEKHLSEEETERVLSLVSRFFDSGSRGELAKDAEEILNHADYALMQSVLWDRNYGPWMEELLKNPPQDASELSFEWK